MRRKRTKTQEAFKEYFDDQSKKKPKKPSNIIHFNKKSYLDRLKEYRNKWFLHVFLPRWLPIIVMVILVLIIFSRVA